MANEMRAVRQITKEELRQMEHREGLILQGCGGDLQEWVDGINQLLTEEGRVVSHGDVQLHL